MDQFEEWVEQWAEHGARTDAAGGGADATTPASPCPIIQRLLRAIEFLVMVKSL